jgi:uncharacterized protein (TIGR01244 family)
MTLPLPFADARVALTGQLKPADMKALAQAGIAVVINNRPDGEALFGQPRTADLEKAAKEAGLVFLDLPFSGPRATPDQVRALADLLAEGEDKIVAFCKSGMRSALLWGAASLANGRSLDEVLAGGRKAGQELSGAAEVMTALAQAARR